MESQQLVREISNLTNALLEENWGITRIEALKLAVQMQRNRIFRDAFVVDKECPNALEAIAIELGAADNGLGLSIKDALYSIASKEQ